MLPFFVSLACGARRSREHIATLEGHSRMAIIAKLLGALFPNVNQACLLILISVCLGACFVAALWELEEARIRWRERSNNRAVLSSQRAPGPRAGDLGGR